MQRKHFDFKWTLQLSFAVATLFIGLCIKGWTEETQEITIEETVITDETTINDDWWRNLDTPQTYTVTHEDGTVYEVTINPDGSSVETVTDPDGRVTTEVWDTPTFNGDVMTHTGTLTTFDGYTVTYTYTKNLRDGSISFVRESQIPGDKPFWSFTQNSDGSTDSIEVWSDGSILLLQGDPPSSDLAIGHLTFIPSEMSTQPSLSATFVVNPDGSFSAELQRFEGVMEEFVRNSDSSGRFIAKDTQGNIVGRLEWDEEGVVTYADGFYDGDGAPPPRPEPKPVPPPEPIPPESEPVLPE